MKKYHVSAHKTSTGAYFGASRYCDTIEEARTEQKDLLSRGYTVEIYEESPEGLKKV